MANSSSPFEEFFVNIFYDIKNNFRRHDKYLNIALLLAIAPFPFLGFIALLISLLGFYLNYKSKFEIDERSRLIAIFLISIVNISLSLTFAYSIYSFVFSSIHEIIFNIKSFFFSFLSTKETFI